MALKAHNKLWLALFTVLLLAASGCVIGEDDGSGNTNTNTNATDDDNNAGDNNNTGDDNLPGDNNDNTNPGDDQNNDNGEDGEDGEDPNDVEVRETALSIKVLDNADQPIAGAKVSLNGTTLESDENGDVRFGDLEPARVVAVIKAEGYAPSSVVADLPEGVEYFHRASILPYGTPMTISGSEGGVVVKDEVRVALPAEGIVDVDGNVVTGDVQVYIAPLDPSTDDYLSAPGPLMGIPDDGGDAVPFVSVFMAEITLYANGEEVNIRPGYSAEVEFMIPEIFQDAYTIGEQSEGWWFNLNEGIWYQDGYGVISEATLDPERKSWKFNATHFTWLNHDVSFRSMNCVIVTVMEKDSLDPVSGAMISTNGITPGGALFRHSPSAADGTTCVDFRAGATLNISAIHPQFRGPATQIQGNSIPASCSGQGQGECHGATIKVQ